MIKAQKKSWTSRVQQEKIPKMVKVIH